MMDKLRDKYYKIIIPILRHPGQVTRRSPKGEAGERRTGIQHKKEREQSSRTYCDGSPVYGRFAPLPG
jgi:hypothetical protein